MKCFLTAITALIVAALTEKTVLAFSPAVSSRISTRLSSTADKDRLKKAGAGITTQVPGDLCFYDPNEQGLMQGSNTLNDRLKGGASFQPTLFAAPTLDAVEDTSTPAPATPTPLPEPTTEFKPKSVSTNLTDLLKGLAGGGRSQY